MAPKSANNVIPLVLRAMVLDQAPAQRVVLAISIISTNVYCLALQDYTMILALELACPV